MQTISIKKKADLEAVFGKELAKVVLGLKRQDYRRNPSSVTLTDTKPPFYLNDGGTLRCYGIDLVEGKILGERYCGSSDTSYLHGEQFDETSKAPENHALLFVETCWNGRNTSWYVTVVSPNVQKQLEGGAA